MKTALYAATSLIAMTGSAFAMQECTPGKEDARVRFCTYSEHQVYHIWTAPGGGMHIEFAPDERIPEGSIGVSDRSRLTLDPRANFLYIKNTAQKGDTPCMVPEPLLLTTKRADGTLRPYQFQFETIPNHCEDTPVVQQQTKTPQQDASNGLGIIHAANAATATTETEKIGNLKYVREGGLGPNADVMYAVVFKYPADERAKREAEERARQAALEEQENKLLMKQQVEFPFGNRFDGTWNYKYAGHGSGTGPAMIGDNGFHTAMLFPAMQSIPSIFSWLPGQQGCNREHDDHKETVVNPSSHTSGAPGDTVILPGTAQGWCLRGGGVGPTATVYEIRNMDYHIEGQTPATNTDSQFVKRVIKQGDTVDGSP